MRLRPGSGCFLSVLLALGLGVGVAQAGDIAYGEYLANECVACHTRAENSGSIPMIYGIDRDYFIEAMQDYRLDVRKNEVMQGVARSLDDQQIEALAAYFSSQK